jgi:putative peptidoglycan binding protein
MNRILILVLVSFCLSPACSWAEPLFHSTDSLAARDEFGLLHQSPSLNPTDFERRHRCRFFYYFESGRSLTSDPAYIGALQNTLRRLGYYCGPIDGLFTSEVSDAIARLQKNYSMRVTGTLTVPVRRALFLP